MEGRARGPARTAPFAYRLPSPLGGPLIIANVNIMQRPQCSPPIKPTSGPSGAAQRDLVEAAPPLRPPLPALLPLRSLSRAGSDTFVQTPVDSPSCRSSPRGPQSCPIKTGREGEGRTRSSSSGCPAIAPAESVREIRSMRVKFATNPPVSLVHLARNYILRSLRSSRAITRNPLFARTRRLRNRRSRKTGGGHAGASDCGLLLRSRNHERARQTLMARSRRQ